MVLYSKASSVSANSPNGVSANIFVAAAVDVAALDCVGGGLRGRVARLGGAEAPFGHVAGGTEVLEGMSAHNNREVKNPEIGAGLIAYIDYFKEMQSISYNAGSFS